MAKTSDEAWVEVIEAHRKLIGLMDALSVRDEHPDTVDPETWEEYEYLVMRLYVTADEAVFITDHEKN